MRINFGYVAMSQMLEDCSPSKTITAANLIKISSGQARTARLISIAKTNIHNTRRLLYHNKAHDIRVFRITSRLIPLATHCLTEKWEWPLDLQDDLAQLGEYARNHNFRISAHPDHFTVINSPKEEVFAASVRDLEYHNQIFDCMGLDSSAKLVIHVGGCYANKEESGRRFIARFEALPEYLQKRIIVENDDKIFTVQDVLTICQQLQIPMVLDIHHDSCNSSSDDLIEYLPDIFSTWRSESLVPKIHLSSPKDAKNFRHHADDVNMDFFLSFLNAAKDLDADFDVMIEAKHKDRALFKLIRDLSTVSYIKLTSQASIEL